MIKILFFYFSLCTLAFAELKINSIIKLEENIPNECGLVFFIDNDNLSHKATISIKKLEGEDTLTIFKIESSDILENADLITSTSKITELLDKKELKEKNLKYFGITPEDSMTFFFQDLLINGGKLNVNKISYEIAGPIDSKVRLEYLFCTGEMFLPNYKPNQNE